MPSGRGVEVSVGEVTDALGDSITALPVVAALAALTPVSLPLALLCFGLFQIVWGVAYGLPLSVEPMEALAGLAIAGTLGYGECLAADCSAGSSSSSPGAPARWAASARPWATR